MSDPNESKYRGVCKGAGDRFTGDGPDPGHCKSYSGPTDECEAVTEGRLSDTFEKEKGRCLIVLVDMIDDLTRKNILWNPDVYVDKEESEDINIKSLVKTLGNATLDHYTIAGWHNYMYWLVKRRVLSKLINRGIIPKDRKEPKCGTCLYLSLLEPYVCRLTDVSKLKGDPSCPEYASWSARRKDWAVADEEEGPHYREELFEHTMPDQETMGSVGLAVEEQIQAAELYDLFETLLKQRILDAKTLFKQAEYKEKHLLFRDMMELMTKGHSESDAKAELAKSVETVNKRDSVRKRIDRYWNNTKDFLREEGKKLGINLSEDMFPKAHRKERAT